jgi:Family of unknown function (DUF6335)
MAKRKSAKTKATRKATKAAKPARGRKAAGRSKGASSASSGRKKTARKAAARKAAPKKALKKVAKKTAKKVVAKKAAAKKAAPKKVAAKTAAPPKAAAPVKAPAKRAAKKTPAPGTERPSIPSSLNLEPSAKTRSGRKEFKEQLKAHTETDPAITAGDVDADWEQAYSSGDEAPGGDNPTPDQDVVDDIGRALGVEYQDSEELKGANKISDRDKHRWELDPASSEDYPDRDS